MIAGDVGAELGLQRLEIDTAVGRRPGSSSTVKPAKAAVAGLVPWARSPAPGCACAAFAARLERGADRQQAAQFAMRAGLGRHRHRRHAGQRGQPMRQLRRSPPARPARSTAAAADGGRQSPAAAPSSRSGADCASSCRSRAGRAHVDGVILPRQPHVVADHFRLAEARQADRRRAAQAAEPVVATFGGSGRSTPHRSAVAQLEDQRLFDASSAAIAGDGRESPAGRLRRR